MKRRHLVFAAAAVLLAPRTPLAHGPKGSKIKGANGGDIVDVEGGHIELVIKPTELALYITDLKDAPLATANLKARVIIQDGAKQVALAMSPREPNLLVAMLTAPLAKDAKIVVSTPLTKDGKPVQARFVAK